MAGMRSRLVGTRASREGEPYTHNANVTDAAMVRRMSNPRPPNSMTRPEKRASGAWADAEGAVDRFRCPATGPIHTGERELAWPSIQGSESQAWCARSRGQKGT
jgi:hypothetical protein